jgi:glycosyltransferase involved in cell wall biosynthesis
VREVPAFKARSERAHSRIRLIYVGRLEQYKGLHLLLEALRGIDNVSLTVVGEGSYRKTLQKLAGNLDVTFVGFTRDPSHFYEEADIFVMPSLGPEGLPLVSLEAMSHSLPCLFSDLPVHREITDDARAALLFRTGDVVDLREKLMSLICSASDRARYSGKAHKEITLKYRSEVARAAYLKVFGVEG